MRITRSYLALALAFVLILTGQSMALARTAPGPDGQIVLCTGTGPVAVLVDDQGQPVGPSHICPDCALSLFQALAETAPEIAAPTSWLRAHPVEFTLVFHSPAPRPAVARGPPQAA